MEFSFSYSLDNENSCLVKNFYNSLPFTVIEQYVGWPSIISDRSLYCYFLAKKDDKIVCFAQINETSKFIFKQADINFGPLYTDLDILIESIIKIRDYYESKKFLMLTIQPALKLCDSNDYFEYKINKNIVVKYKFDRNNWSSIYINLKLENEEIFKKFSKGHKSDIKKGQKLGLKVISDEINKTDLNMFFELYVRMRRVRKLTCDENQILKLIEQLFNYFRESKKGKFFLIKNSEDEIVGGVVLIFQGKTVRYFLGAADPERRDLPILHLALWESILYSKANDFDYFDFWGYNHFVDETDQVFHINKFKKGFGGEFSFFPKRMYFIYRPFLRFIYCVLLNIKNLFYKL